MMELANRPSPSLWHALLWKELQQMKQTVLAVAIGLFCIQVMLVLIGFASGATETKNNAFAGTIQLACVAPILIALGCAGLLIGQERQTGTWAWSSSLPVTWQQSLGSKLIVSTLCSLFVLIPASIVPVWLDIAGYLTAANSLTAASLRMTLMVLLETIVVCFLTTLMIKETLNALVVAGAVMIAIEFGIWASVHSMQDSGIKFTHYDGDLFLFSTIAWFIKAVLFGVLLMPIAFRWRWGVGQQAVLSVAANTSSIPVPSYASYRIQTGRAPSEWQMMLRHSFANSFWLRIITALATVALALMAPMELLPMILYASFYVFGVSVFEGDQTLSRIRFLADRGVRPWKLVTSRLAVAAIIPVLVVVFVLGLMIVSAGPGPLWNAISSIAPIPFLVGAFASMCFRKTIVATTLGVVMQAIGFASFVLVVEWVRYHADPAIDSDSTFYMLVLSMMPIVSATLLAAIFALSYRWIVKGDAKLGPHFLGGTLVSILCPIFLASTFGFWLVPNTPWQEIAIPEPSSSAKTPSIELIEHPFLFGKLDMESDLWKKVIQFEEFLAGHGDPRDPTVFFKSLLAASKEDVPSDGKLVDLNLRYRDYDSSLSHVIIRTAALASICLEKKEPETALRFWRANRELQEFSHRFDPAWTREARTVSMQLLSSLKEEEVAALGGYDVVHGLIPAVANERTGKIHQHWLNANQSRDYFRNSNVAYYPPLLWRVERQLAYRANASIKLLPPGPEDYLTGAYRDVLLKQYP